MKRKVIPRPAARDPSSFGVPLEDSLGDSAVNSDSVSKLVPEARRRRIIPRPSNAHSIQITTPEQSASLLDETKLTSNVGSRHPEVYNRTLDPVVTQVARRKLIPRPPIQDTVSQIAEINARPLVPQETRRKLIPQPLTGHTISPITTNVSEASVPQVTRRQIPRPPFDRTVSNIVPRQPFVTGPIEDVQHAINMRNTATSAPQMTECQIPHPLSNDTEGNVQALEDIDPHLVQTSPISRPETDINSDERRPVTEDIKDQVDFERDVIVHPLNKKSIHGLAMSDVWFSRTALHIHRMRDLVGHESLIAEDTKELRELISSDLRRKPVEYFDPPPESRRVAVRHPKDVRQTVLEGTDLDPSNFPMDKLSCSGKLNKPAEHNYTEENLAAVHHIAYDSPFNKKQYLQNTTLMLENRINQFRMEMHQEHKMAGVKGLIDEAAEDLEELINSF